MLALPILFAVFAAGFGAGYAVRSWQAHKRRTQPEVATSESPDCERLLKSAFKMCRFGRNEDLVPAVLHKVIAAAAWTTLAFIAFATLSPLALRPEVGDANLERFGAYALAGLLMALAYPRHLIPVALFVVGVAAVLEVLQLVTPDRHGQFANAVVKAVGGIAGVTAAFIILRLTRADLDRLG